MFGAVRFFIAQSLCVFVGGRTAKLQAIKAIIVQDPNPGQLRWGEMAIAANLQLCVLTRWGSEAII